MSVPLAYLIFPFVAVAVFRFAAPATAALVVFLGGWLLLPVGNYPPGSTAVVFPYWITGLAVPSSMLLTKAWVTPASALLGVMLFDRPALARLRPSWMDLPVALWCMWPLLQSFMVTGSDPTGWLSSVYLLGSWGLPWLLGRLYFSEPAGQMKLLKAIAISTIACLPFSLLEGIVGPVAYGWIYGSHPFRYDGAERYVGFRPMGYFEHGNQFGLWVCMGALAAVTIVAASRRSVRTGTYVITAMVTLLMALAAQSVGAILLLCLGLLVFSLIQWVRPRLLLMLPLFAVILGGGIVLSGAVPIADIGKNTAVGQKVVQVFRSAGRGSFTWRISQDQKLIDLALTRPLAGTGQWEWWREKEIRPWGLELLLVGQFGLAGMVLAMGAFMWSPALCAWRAPRAGPASPWFVPLSLATIVFMAALDTLMNSFIYFPALVIAGGLTKSSGKPAAGHAAPSPLR